MFKVIGSISRVSDLVQDQRIERNDERRSSGRIWKHKMIKTEERWSVVSTKRRNRRKDERLEEWIDGTRKE